VGSPGDPQGPTTGEELEVVCICCLLSNSPSLSLHCGTESRGRFHLFLFSDTLKETTAFSGDDARAHTSFLENTNLAASASVILAPIFLHKAVPALFFLAKFCSYEVVCRRRKGGLATHEVPLSVILVWCHLGRVCSQHQNHAASTGS